MIVVYLLTALALILFMTEIVPVDVAAILIMVLLVVLEPWTQVTPAQGLSGFANPATLTILAMFILSEGVRRTGLLRRLGRAVARLTGTSEGKQIAATIGMAGSTAGFVNNTPIVAMLIPVVTDLAERTGTSVSKLLIPLSYAAMLGGMLTVIGTSSSLVASDLTDQLLDRGPIGMFEFTALGGLVLLTGSVYLLTLGRVLLPERVKPGGTLIDRFELADYMSELVVTEDSSLVDTTARDAFAAGDEDVLIWQIIRDRRVLPGPYAHRRFRVGDVLRVRADRDTLMEFVERRRLEFAAESPSEAAETDTEAPSEQLVEVVVLPNAALTGESLASVRFRQRYDATVLAVRRSGRLQNRALSSLRLRGGDTLLVQATEEAVRQLSTNRNFVVTQEIAPPEFRTGKTPVALGIVVAVVLLAAVDLLPIAITALGGMVAMVLTGCLQPSEIYDAVDWNVIFLLAGIIPLGLALDQTGGAAYLASIIVPLADLVPMVLFAALFYLLTAVITEFITNLGSVVLMLPVAIDVALQTGADPFAFVLLVVFSASDSLMTPVGYQTNLMVFNQGGYQFVDFLRVGVPLQLLLAVVTAVGIAIGWGY